ncbi:DnaJ domain-containing protein [Colletotrichum graminicola]|uniref:DnaJ domain-containing protein n=1 Tax=Colletotrichum graminicola (strain M1.001 / M2 / FGSC 10212) TaxID=645133 RepID=E3Q4L1_COLGM|nr:DnaJ domain-containing protein [Colletotrichum graminicola M1.001]EFQ26026.1 DnaJ domain-containing protein [Colletotrichum graminicola M1.001]WDK23158.1 DnaJ domain-containing protein [Colletotrichum graminicola]
MSSSLPPDPYKILGVSKDAQLPEIRSAHRKLVLKCHPDKVQDPTLKAQKQDEFQKVQQAYELLSNENDRAKYDDNVKLAELRKEMAKGMAANTSAPRAPRTYDVRTAEPRPDTFKTTSYRSSPNTKMYSQYNSRSWDEDLHSRSNSNSIFEEPRARRATSYEKPSRQDDDLLRERRRREEKEREREELARAAAARDRERLERERERMAEKKVAEKAAKRAAEEKEARRQERKRMEKAEKEREKSRRHKPIYSEPFDDDATYVAKADKKKSSSTKEKKEDKRSRSVPRDVVPPREELPVPPVPPMPLAQTDIQHKYAETMIYAAKYMDESRKSVHPGITRSQTYDVRPPVPTPPPAGPSFAAPPPPPIPQEEDTTRRSKSRRSSETKTRDKSSHKKSSPTKEAPLPPPPNVVDASPSSRHMAHFAPTTAYPASTSPPKYLSRSATLNESSFSRPLPGPIRSQTFSHVPADTDLRGRGRSRMQPQAVSEDSESEDDHHRRHRSSRHKTHSPDPMPAEHGQRTRYTVSAGRAVAVPPESAYAAMYHDESTPPSRKHSKNTYYERPPMPSREPSYSSSTYFPKVKTARYDDVQYSNIPHRYREEYTAYA